MSTRIVVSQAWLDHMLELQRLIGRAEGHQDTAERCIRVAARFDSVGHVEDAANMRHLAAVLTRSVKRLTARADAMHAEAHAIAQAGDPPPGPSN